MKFTCTIILLLAFTLGFSQNQSNSYQNDRKGQLYFYWGWNWGWYSKSNIHFKGPDYDFTLDKVSAKDRQGKFDANIYMNNTLTYGGYKFFQTSYDTDEKGTLLTVNKDPGKILTYIGYTLLFFGLILNFFDKKSRFRFLMRKIKNMPIKNFGLITN